MVKGRSMFAGAGRLAAGALLLAGVVTFIVPVNEANAQFSFGFGNRQRFMPARPMMARPMMARPSMVRPAMTRAPMTRPGMMARPMNPAMTRIPNRYPPAMTRVPNRYPTGMTRVPNRYPTGMTRIPNRYPAAANRIPNRYPPNATRPTYPRPTATRPPPQTTPGCRGRNCGTTYPPIATRPTPNPRPNPCAYGRRGCNPPPPVVGCRGPNCGEYPPRIPSRPPRIPPVIVVPQPPVIVPQPSVVVAPVRPVGPPVVVAPARPIGPPVVMAPPVRRPPPPPTLVASLPPSRWTPPPAPPRLAPVAIPAARENRFVPNEVLVEFRGQPSQAVINTFARANRLTLLMSSPSALSGTTLHQFRIDDRRDVRTVLRGLSRDQRVERAQPNFIFDLVTDQRVPATDAMHAPILTDRPNGEVPVRSAPSSVAPPAPVAAPSYAPPPPPPGATSTVAPAAPPLASTPSGAPPPAPAQEDESFRQQQYALQRLRALEAHRLVRGERVVVAVIDSGVDAAHPELMGVVRQVIDVTGGSGAAECHGTAMVGAIAARARLAGVAPAAEIVAIRAFDNAEECGRGRTTSMTLRTAFNQAAAAGARVVNMSFAGPRDPQLSRLLEGARQHGVVLIAASGNNGASAEPQYPAADPNVIAVIATDPEDRLYQDAVRGRHIAVAAPGVDVLVPAPGGGYDTSTGTSVAAAHVSGVAALLLQRNELLDGDTVRRVLTATARSLTGVGPDAGAGLVDALAAVSAVPPGTTPRPSAALQ